MEQKSNKTDHVLNLLSGVKKKDKKKVTTEPIQEHKTVEDVSDVIQKELEKELTKELDNMIPILVETLEELPVQEDLSLQESKPEDVVENRDNIEIKEENDGTQVELKEINIENNEEQAQPDNMENPKTDEYEFINVMEHVVSVHAKEYMDMFDTCSCSRCKADVIAYSLTHLPSKYIVVNVEEKIPLMSFYEKKYASQMRVELIKACMVVKENPHHK